MMTETIHQKAEQYKDIYTQLKNDLKWKVSDQRILMMIASLYVVKGKTFERNRFLDLCDYIKNNVGAFSTLRSYQRFTTAAMLDIRFEHPKEKFQEFINLYEQLVKGEFRRGTFTYIAALVMLTEDDDDSNHQESIKRAHSVYNGMKEKHFFLTNASDYPLAVLLAELDGDVDQVMNHVEAFYDKLASAGFRKGNDLQFLSHILSMDKKTNADFLIEKCIQVFEEFRQGGKKIKNANYPEIGMLSLLEDGKNDIAPIRQLADYLDSEKLFKWYKDMNFTVAVNLVISDRIKNTDLLETGIFTTMETLIQAQQAAMVAIIASTSAAAASSGGE
ncbi:DUF4003 family protein [Metabacillus arenae]|uniref:DUF4003 domain-containing protein n=1 Tax=Metabacillus arenae TaxID=2771434 RepID=A0A926NGA0_9BACI|nr:DUF4003 family protein [Metabacillus arenae]MBD1380741.1 DUF4003 domain-containing protein [Metabacillus arenae]